MEATTPELPTRILVLAGPLESENIVSFIKEFSETDSEEGPIEIRICSSGGDLYGAMGIFDLIRSSRNPVTTVGYGEVCSAAALIFQAGDHRQVCRNCTFLLHPVSDDEIGGTVEKVVLQAKETERIHTRMCKILSSSSGQPLSKIQEFCRHETYLDSDQVLALGLADEILETA